MSNDGTTRQQNSLNARSKDENKKEELSISLSYANITPINFCTPHHLNNYLWQRH